MHTHIHTHVYTYAHTDTHNHPANIRSHQSIQTHKYMGSFQTLTLTSFAYQWQTFRQYLKPADTNRGIVHHL